MNQNYSVEDSKSGLQFVANAKNSVLILVNFIGFAGLLVYGSINIYRGSFVIGILEIAGSLIFFIAFLYTAKTKKATISKIIQIIIFQLLIVYLFKTGGIEKAGVFWLFLAPVIYFFYMGDKKGVFWFLVQLAIMMVQFVLSKFDVITIAYNDITVYVVTTVLIIESVILYIHERILRHHIVQEKVLRGLLPICSNCKKIRDDDGYWNNIESYIKIHSEADFTHGICPECTEKLYPGYILKKTIKD